MFHCIYVPHLYPFMQIGFWKKEKENKILFTVFLSNKEQGRDKSKSSEREEEPFPNSVRERGGN